MYVYHFLDLAANKAFLKVASLTRLESRLIERKKEEVLKMILSNSTVSSGKYLAISNWLRFQKLEFHSVGNK